MPSVCSRKGARRAIAASTTAPKVAAVGRSAPRAMMRIATAPSLW